MRDLQSLRTPVPFTFHSDLTLQSHCCSDCLQSVFVAVCMISGCLAKCLIVYNPAIMSRTCINDSLYRKALTFLYIVASLMKLAIWTVSVAISHEGRSTFKVGIKLVSGNHLTWYGYPFTFFCGHSEHKTLTIFTSLSHVEAYLHQRTKPSLVQITACRLFGAKPLPTQCWLIANWNTVSKFQQKMKYNNFDTENWIWKYLLQIGCHLFEASCPSIQLRQLYHNEDFAGNVMWSLGNTTTHVWPDYFNVAWCPYTYDMIIINIIPYNHKRHPTARPPFVSSSLIHVPSLSLLCCMHYHILQRFVMETIAFNIISSGFFAYYMIMDISHVVNVVSLQQDKSLRIAMTVTNIKQNLFSLMRSLEKTIAHDVRTDSFNAAQHNKSPNYHNRHPTAQVSLVDSKSDAYHCCVVCIIVYYNVL